MGYVLVPRNKAVGAFNMGSFTWSWILNAGVGLVIGTGPAKNPCTHSYVRDAKGRSPHCNDGYRVTAEQARAMALVARGLVQVQRFINTEWDQMSENARKDASDRNSMTHLYRDAIRDDFLDTAERFAEWAAMSGGFTIE